MKLEFSRPILDAKGKEIPVLDENGQKTEDSMTLQSLAESSLLATFADERDLAVEEKVKRFKLFNKISANPDVEMTAEEVVLLKKCIGKLGGPLLVGRAYEIIDPPKKGPENG